MLALQSRQPCSHRIVIAGNHDHHLQAQASLHLRNPLLFLAPIHLYISSPRQEIGAARARALLPNCTYLCHEQHTAAGLRFLASPYSRGNSPNQAFQGENPCNHPHFWVNCLLRQVAMMPPRSKLRWRVLQEVAVWTCC